ncbi:RNA polymerase sigma factor [Rhodomicrobium lacus]|uniref:RNA polymerase sigma factor n=1 Tax=Rhodomicrobium lacus TaxID=2498452 RepID=UPI000F8DDD58|nr:RNA polymerase sigma factor [Rhodomicrobium lacus]
MTIDHFGIAALYSNEQARLKRKLQRQGLTASSADDAVQDAFLRLLRFSGADIQNERAYINRVAETVASNTMRGTRRGAAVIDPCAAVDENVADAAPLADARIISQEQLTALEAAISELPTRCREVLLLHKYEDLSYAEIAAHLGIAKNTVMVHMVKALARLRACLQEQ